MTGPILVTGATGSVGGAVVDELLARGANVRVLVRDPAARSVLQVRGVQAVVGDLADAGSLEKAVDGVERAFLLTPGKPYFPDAVSFAEHFIAAARPAGVRMVVRQSIWRSSLDQVWPPAMQDHARIETALTDAGFDVTVLQPNYGMQSLDAAGIIADAVADGHFFQPLGEAGVAYVDLRDVGAVAAVCLTSDEHVGRIYRLSGPEILTSPDMAAVLAEVIGRPVSAIAPTVEQAMERMRTEGLPAWHVDHYPELLAHNQSGALAQVTTAVEDVTGRPARSWAGYVRERLNELS